MITKTWCLSGDVSEQDLSWMQAVGFDVSITFDTVEVQMDGKKYKFPGKRKIQVVTRSDEQQTLLMLRINPESTYLTHREYTNSQDSYGIN